MEELDKEQTAELGVVLFEKSNAKHALDAPTGKVGAKGMAQRIYMIICAALMFGWFLYSFINEATNPEEGIVNAILSHIASFFVLFVAEFILFLTAFNAWGKFSRAMLKHKSLERHYGREAIEYRKLQEEFAEVDANKAKECAIRVYQDCVVLVNDGETTVINRSDLRRVKCEPDPRAELHGYQVTFELYDKEPIIAAMPLSTADIPRFKKHFDNFEYVPASRGKAYFKKKLPMVAFMLVPILIGTAIIIVRSLVLPDMPLIIGVAFLSFGILLMLAQFSDVAVIGNGIIMICTGLLLVGLPIAIALTIVDLAEEVTIAYLLTYFSPLHAGLSVFFGFGPMLIIVGIAGLIDSLRI